MDSHTDIQTSVFIARLLGPVFLTAGFALLLDGKRFREILREFIDSPALLYFAGFLGLLGGLALVLTHNVWLISWRLLITVMGWVTLVRALATMFRPQWIVAAGRVYLEHPAYISGAAVLSWVLGFILSYFGYFA
ncbi:MAG: hypothetical protein WBX25_37140 [Rhodomicrobium sp.]